MAVEGAVFQSVPRVSAKLRARDLGPTKLETKTQEQIQTEMKIVI